MAEKWMMADQIRHNRRATVRLFVVMFLILWGLAWGIGYLLGHPPYITGFFALVFGLVYLAMASGFSVEAILKAARAKPADPRIREQKLLLYKVEELAIAAGIPKPKVYVQESRDINAFATGRKPEEGVVCVTTGAMAALDAEEMEGVLAHELSHIKNYDIRVSTYAVALIGIIAMIAEMVWWSLFFSGGRRGGDAKQNGILIIVAIALMILAPLLSRMTYLAISRRREYLADASGAHMTRNPEGLARALQKIANTKPEPHHGDRTVASLYLANPFKRTRRESLWSTHPPIDERIARLRRM